MNRDLVLAEWRRAIESLRAAESLAKEDLAADSISRAYYATLHAAKAVLLIHDVTAESQAAVRRMFGLQLIQPGTIEREWAINLAHIFDDRISADYDVEITFTEKDDREECKRAKAF